MNRSPFTVLVFALVATMAGCAAPKDRSSETLPPTLPELVTLYQARPRSYEVVGTIVMPITADMKLDQRGQSAKFFETLKAMAAEKGANGVLFRDVEGSPGITTTMGYNGTFYQVPVRLQPEHVAVVTAIWVKPTSTGGTR